MEGIIYEQHQHGGNYYTYSYCANGVHWKSKTFVMGDKGRTTYFDFRPCDGRCKKSIHANAEVLAIIEKVVETGEPQKDEVQCIE
ncbi:MAG: hypothetical protein Q8K92_08890 [Leadbetterella sp.]|nr:hypothetical protein [Leadbetterella sp.]